DLTRSRASPLPPLLMPPPPTAISPLSLHDALPIYNAASPGNGIDSFAGGAAGRNHVFDYQGPFAGRYGETASERKGPGSRRRGRSEEHTSELQSLTNLVCRLLLENKKKNIRTSQTT